MNITASIRFSLKNRDKDYHGLLGSTVAVGKSHPLPLSETLMGVIAATLEFYTDTAGQRMTAAQLQAEKQKAAEWLARLEFREGTLEQYRTEMENEA